MRVSERTRSSLQRLTVVSVSLRKVAALHERRHVTIERDLREPVPVFTAFTVAAAVNLSHSSVAEIVALLFRDDLAYATV
jgi:hypothetical protein